MRHRLTALVLAFIMASPACWCGWTHAAAEAHVRTCCQAKAKKQNLPAKEKDCPCSQAIKARDLAQGKVSVPAPSLVDLHLTMVPAIAPVLSEIMHSFAVTEPHEHGPPREIRPLYHLDCALLI